MAFGQLLNIANAFTQLPGQIISSITGIKKGQTEQKLSDAALRHRSEMEQKNIDAKLNELRLKLAASAEHDAAMQRIAIFIAFGVVAVMLIITGGVVVTSRTKL